MTVLTFCAQEVDVAEPGESVRACASRMLARNVGSLVVVDERRHPTGIVTDRDLALRIVAEGRDPEGLTVADVMTPNPHTVAQDSSLAACVAQMREKGVRRLPVVDQHGVLEGVVSLDDVMGCAAKSMADAAELLRASSPRTLAEA